MNSSVKVDTILGTPTLSQTFLPIDPEFNELWSPIALAIQRGRDHGIPPYHKALNLCEARLGLAPGAKITFEDVEQMVGADGRKLLESMYQHPEDIDLLAGALLETPALGTVFGPTCRVCCRCNSPICVAPIVSGMKMTFHHRRCHWNNCKLCAVSHWPVCCVPPVVLPELSQRPSFARIHSCKCRHTMMLIDRLYGMNFLLFVF